MSPLSPSLGTVFTTYALSHSSGSSLFTGFFLSTCTYAHIFPTTKTNKNPHTHLASLIAISLSLSLAPATTELPGGLSHVGRTHSWATQSLVCPVPGGSVPTISGSPWTPNSQGPMLPGFPRETPSFSCGRHALAPLTRPRLPPRVLSLALFPLSSPYCSFPRAPSSHNGYPS